MAGALPGAPPPVEPGGLRVGTGTQGGSASAKPSFFLALSSRLLRAFSQELVQGASLFAVCRPLLQAAGMAPRARATWLQGTLLSQEGVFRDAPPTPEEWDTETQVGVIHLWGSPGEGSTQAERTWHNQGETCAIGSGDARLSSRL